MKTIAFLSIFLISHIFPLQFAKREAIEKSLSHQHVLILKVDQKFRGGEVEVVSQGGDTIVKQVLFRRKMKIDFQNVKPGTYIVKMKKGMLVESFHYQRK
jgi:hypothetical protein